ncbi:NAD(+)--dinitrogen-reductase ADP-D-ribosyltransferase [Pelagicoccus sp. SDUM812003]|uniref:NAD(+)--dinitrogen-reductase ADP-D-ribosyltransferase n=1 Tax=Pelagicoccus sp. SDUM812003 TaxID=3041267 RepID=UPI00280D6B20|nr:NAD(+)--dinitrogen-reductase ADP-D-ribosyltransferase [Pelagicoccus sp. SDUM812003]MDQ8203651.1 NAD(+)--dinitrogen-reductase ADP-D-ribosyltransferase [Pelagicoccus sp. SDUM812003]
MKTDITTPPSLPPESIWFGHCEIPPWKIASFEFNEDPRPLSLIGVRATNQRLFRELDKLSTRSERGTFFHDYVSVKFGLHNWKQYSGRSGQCIRNSYLRYLTKWGVDSSSVEGAVLKYWVQSRFGLYPTFHRKKLRIDREDEDYAFARDRVKGAAFTNAIEAQLDLVYEYCQYELKRAHPDKQHLQLFRGTYDPEEHPVISVGDKRQSCIRLNNLCSFTSDRERAWEFGSTVWGAKVPLVKILFFSGLLPNDLLCGEDEYLVIGGEYWVKEHLY